MRVAIRSGAVVPVLLMIPNVAWMLYPGPGGESRSAVPPALALAENVTRVVVLALPCFRALDLERRYAVPALLGMALALGVYYAAWIRFFDGGGAPALLGMPLAGIPAPLAFAPLALLAISSYLLASSWMLAAALCFGALHIWASALAR